MGVNGKLFILENKQLGHYASHIYFRGCSQSSQILPTITLSTSTVIPPGHTIIKPSPIPSTSIAPIHSSTPIPIATSFSANTQTPVQIIGYEEGRKVIARLMETNNSCSGFCFWGITPGVTNFDMAISFLKTLKDKALVETDDQFRIGYQFKREKITISLRLTSLSGKVQNIHITVDGLYDPDVIGKDWLAFKPDSFLKSYGPPEKVNIIMYEGPEGRIGYEMVLIYDQMFIRYSGNQFINKTQSVLHVCPLADQNIERFELWLGQYDEKTRDDGKELSRVTSLTSENFYQILVGDPSNACFDLDYNNFLSPK